MGIWNFLKQVGGGLVNGAKYLRKNISQVSGPIKDFIKQVVPAAGDVIDKSQPIRDLLGKGFDYGLNSAGAAFGQNARPKFDITGQDVGNAFNAIGPTLGAASNFL